MIDGLCKGLEGLIALALMVLRYGFNTGHLGVDMVVNRLPVWGKRICLVVGHALMLFIVALLFQGSLEQTKINWDVTAPTTGWSMAWVAAAGLVFSVLAAGLLLLDLGRVLSGRLRDDELVMVQESEEAAQMRQVLAVPFFMLAGEVMNVGGLSRRIVNLALALVGHVKGGLDYVAIMAGCRCPPCQARPWPMPRR